MTDNRGLESNTAAGASEAELRWLLLLCADGRRRSHAGFVGVAAGAAEVRCGYDVVIGNAVVRRGVEIGCPGNTAGDQGVIRATDERVENVVACSCRRGCNVR